MSTRPAASQDEIADRARRRFVRFIVDQGTQRTQNKIIAPAEAMTYDGDCWSAAWRYAQRLIEAGRDVTYVEGSCVIPAGVDGLGNEHPKNRVVRAHSWVETAHPLLGTVVVELTRGYETAIRYRGVPVDATPGGHVDKATAGWDQDERSSVIEAALADPAVTPEAAMRMIAKQ